MAMPRVVSGKNGGLDMQRMTMPMFVPKTQLQHAADRLQSESCEDNGSAESRAEAKINPKCITYGYVEGCHWDKWLAHNRHT